MSHHTIYALRTDNDWASEIGVNIFDSLKQGEGRFGWSGTESADLRELEKRIQAFGWETLSKEEKDCYKPFLLDLERDDYAVYINVPEYGKCTLARVTGGYYWQFTHRDYNHRFPVDTGSVREFHRNDATVHPALRSRLKLQGRQWQIYCKEEFEELVRCLQNGGEGKASPPSPTNIERLAQEVQQPLNDITWKVHHTFPGADLEGLLEIIFQKIPGVLNVKRQGGPHDRGADLLVEFESGLPIPGLQEQGTLVVQVKSFEGEMHDTRAVDDIRRAFDQYKTDIGLIVSTAKVASPTFGQALEKLQEDTEKTVGLLIGPEVARFLLRFGSDLIDLDTET